MYKETSAASHGDLATSAITTMSSSFVKSPFRPRDVVYSPLQSPVFQEEPSLPTSISFTSNRISDSKAASASTLSKHIYHTRAVQEHQEMVNRHSLCLTHLREATEEAEYLRHENTKLRSVNRELNKHLNILIDDKVQPQLVSPDYSIPYDIVDGFHGLHVGPKEGNSSTWDNVSDESPTSVMENGRIENVEVERFSLPKSISVRSNGYLNLKMTQNNSNNGGLIRPSTMPRTTSPIKVAQKVFVPVGMKEEEPLELELKVYNQGMFKTELCNKWQQTGACPYGDQCQFAHGIEELRPVIRHPRYKTEVCRMVLSGVVCPYGHRCHFRHALTDQERLMGALNLPAAIKLERMESYDPSHAIHHHRINDQISDGKTTAA